MSEILHKSIGNHLVSQTAHDLEFCLRHCNSFFLYRELGIETREVSFGRLKDKALTEAACGIFQGAGRQLQRLKPGKIAAVLQGDGPPLPAEEAIAAVVARIAQDDYRLMPRMITALCPRAAALRKAWQTNLRPSPSF